MSNFLNDKQVKMLIPVYKHFGNYEDVSNFLFDKTGIKLSYEDYDRVVNQSDLEQVKNEEKKQYHKDYNKAYYEQNKEKMKEYHKVYNKKHYQENKEKILERKREHYKNNREKILEYKKQYQEQNKEKIKEYYKKHSKTKNGKVGIIKANYKYRIKNEKEDFIYKLKYLFRYQIIGSNECENTYWKYDQDKNKIIWLKGSI